MELLASHVVLAEGEDTEKCRKQVLYFFANTSLVCYDKIVIDDRIPSATDSFFSNELDKAIEQNRRILNRFVDELGKTGFEQRTDMLRLDQGYHSKILHIIAHFLDGFIGIDSAFYNLVEESHWLSEETENRIKKFPDHYRLLFLRCYSLTRKEASLLHA